MVEQAKREWRDRRLILKIIKKEIDKWNPYGLLTDCTEDEFDGESESIAMHIDWNYTADKIAKTISDEFTLSFGDFDMFSFKSCVSVAENIRDSMDYFIKNSRIKKLS